MNKILGYRKMAGFTQKDMAIFLNISEVTYREKEKGNSEFSKTQMEKFVEAIQTVIKDVNIVDIFFSYKPTKTDVS